MNDNATRKSAHLANCQLAGCLACEVIGELAAIHTRAEQLQAEADWPDVVLEQLEAMRDERDEARADLAAFQSLVAEQSPLIIQAQANENALRAAIGEFMRSGQGREWVEGLLNVPNPGAPLLALKDAAEKFASITVGLEATAEGQALLDAVKGVNA